LVVFLVGMLAAVSAPCQDIQKLAEDLKSSDIFVRRTAGPALGRFIMNSEEAQKNGPLIVATLRPMLDDERQYVRVTALSLVNGTLSEFSGRWRLTQAEAGGLARLARDLQDPDPFVRYEVGWVMRWGYLQVDKGLRAAGEAAYRQARTEIHQWEEAEEANTSSAYEHFAAAYPGGKLAEEARRRIDDPAYAFLVYVKNQVDPLLWPGSNHPLTITVTGKDAQRRTEQAMEGYRQSFPSSPYAALAKDFAEFMAANRGVWKGFMNRAHWEAFSTLEQFVSAHPDSPLIVAAIRMSPLLMMKQAGGTVPVAIQFGNLEKGRSITNPQQVKDKVWTKIHDELAAEGIPSVLVGAQGQQPSPMSPYRLTGTYSESMQGYIYTTPGMRGSMVQHYGSRPEPDPVRVNLTSVSDGRDLFAAESALDAKIVFPEGTIMLPDGTIVPRGISLDGAIVLSHHTNGDFAILPLLNQDPADKRSALVRFLLTLPHVDLTDAGQRQAAKSTLDSLMQR
jgi:hypothetical protein